MQIINKTSLFVKSLFLLFFVFASNHSFNQQDLNVNRHYAAMQFGGQTITSFHYEYAIISKKYFELTANLGVGLNENADDTDPNDRAIYGIHSGFIGLFGIKQVSLEIGLKPTTYFYKSTTFVNLNGWFGLRHCSKKDIGFYVAYGYTPRLFYTYSNPNYFDTSIGLKIGVNF